MRNRKHAVVITLMFIIGIFLSPLINLPVEAEKPTQIDIKPSKDHLKINENFYATISIAPDQPIICVEIDLSFNATLIQCDDVSNGNPSVWNNFFSPIIDNINGEIIGACVCDFTSPYVTDPTDCFIITFTAQNTDGTSPLDIHDVGITNSTGNIIEDISQKDASIVITEDKSSTPPDTPSIPSGSTTGLTSTVYYYSTATEDPDNDQVYYWFDWSDHTDSGWIGPYSSGGTASSSKTWNTPGTYTIKAKAKDEHGNESNWSLPLTVTITNQDTGSDDQGENTPPVAQFTYHPTIPTTKNIIQFTDHSTDLNGTITQWHWDFGDNINATAQNPNHIYTNKGAYNVTFTIWDDNGATNTTTQHVIVANTPPKANFTYTLTSPLPSETIQFLDQSTDLDGTITSWQWNFGDGSNSTENNTQHRYNTSGTYTVTLNITDNDGAPDSVSTTVTVRETSNMEENNSGDDTTGDITEGTENTPGFELIFAFCAIALVLFLKRKRRL